jgi:GT2 family glycosyltransferase
MAPSVWAIVLNYNGARDTSECLASLLSSDYPSLKLLLVDNGSAEQAWKIIPTGMPSVEVLDNGANLGYAEGNNRGIRLAFERGADYALVLNNDTVVVPDMVTRLVAAAERHPKAAMIAPLITFYDEPDRIDSCGTEMDWLRLRPRPALHGRPVAEAPAGPTAMQIVPGSAILLRRDWCARHGLFDEELFLIHEDADLCLRNRAAGGENLLAPDAVARHKRSRTLSSYPYLTQYYTARNFLYLAVRRAAPGEKVLAAVGFVFYFLRTLGGRCFASGRARTECAGALAGIVDFMRGRKGPCPRTEPPAGSAAQTGPR